MATSQAAVIVWGSPTTLSDYTSPDVTAVDTTGTLLAAKKFGAGSADYTVNGVSFLAAEANISISVGGFTGSYTVVGGNTLATMLSTLNFAPDSPQTLTLSGLTNGQAYSLQVFTPIWNNANFPLTLTAGNTVTLANGFTGTSTPSQYVIGNFIADSTSQTIALTSPTATYYTISAAQVRVIPEPSTYAMFLGALAALALLRRRRRF